MPLVGHTSEFLLQSLSQVFQMRLATESGGTGADNQAAAWLMSWAASPLYHRQSGNVHIEGRWLMARLASANHATDIQ